MSNFLFCDCELVPKFVMEWGLEDYIIDSLEYCYRLHVPFDILDEEFTEERITSIWRMLLHVNFCKKPFGKGKEVNRENVRYVCISLMDWIHKYGLKSGCSKKQEMPGCSLHYIIKPNKMEG